MSVTLVFFLMIRLPPISTQSRSSAASDVYKRQALRGGEGLFDSAAAGVARNAVDLVGRNFRLTVEAVSYTHLRAHETPEHLVCRLLLEKKQ